MYKGAREGAVLFKNTCSTSNDAGGNSELYGRGYGRRSSLHENWFLTKLIVIRWWYLQLQRKSNQRPQNVFRNLSITMITTSFSACLFTVFESIKPIKIYLYLINLTLFNLIFHCPNLNTICSYAEIQTKFYVLHVN